MKRSVAPSDANMCSRGRPAPTSCTPLHTGMVSPTQDILVQPLLAPQRLGHQPRHPSCSADRWQPQGYQLEREQEEEQEQEQHRCQHWYRSSPPANPAALLSTSLQPRPLPPPPPQPAPRTLHASKLSSTPRPRWHRFAISLHWQSPLLPPPPPPPPLRPPPPPPPLPPLRPQPPQHPLHLSCSAIRWRNQMCPQWWQQGCSWESRSPFASYGHAAAG